MNHCKFILEEREREDNAGDCQTGKGEEVG